MCTGQIKEYYTDAWNILDLAGCANVFVVVAVCGGDFPDARQSTAFRVVAALGCLSVWLKVGKCCQRDQKNRCVEDTKSFH